MFRDPHGLALCYSCLFSPEENRCQKHCQDGWNSKLLEINWFLENFKSYNSVVNFIWDVLFCFAFHKKCQWVLFVIMLFHQYGLYPLVFYLCGISEVSNMTFLAANWSFSNSFSVFPPPPPFLLFFFNFV